MNRLFWGIAFLFLAAAGSWAQSTWRGQAELWSAKNVPANGFVAASNEFPLNTLLLVENYKTRKTIQVRVVAPLPAGSSDLVMLSPKAAQALDIKTGEVPLVGVQIDPTGVDRPDNPDPDVNPLVPQPAAGTAPGSNAPGLLPLPAVAAPSLNSPGNASRTPLAVADEPDTAAPSTPGKRVFQSTQTPPLAADTSGNPGTPPVPATGTGGVAQAPLADQGAGPVASPADAPAVDVPAAAVPAAPAVDAVAPVTPLAVKPASGWVAVPGKIEGPVLGQVPLLAALEKGKPYVQLGSWATEADVAATLASVKSYVPLALYKAEGQKNPWRVIAAAPKGQLGVLLMLYRSQGLRTAAVVKG